MSTTTIIAQDDLAVVTLKEVEALALEIFTSVYGADWGYAITEAVNTITDLAHYAAEWDAETDRAQLARTGRYATDVIQLHDDEDRTCAACHTNAYGPSAMQPAFCYECVNAMLHGHDSRLAEVL